MISNIVTIIISVLSAIIAAFITTKKSQEQFLDSNCKEDVGKAISLAELYAKEIIPYIESINIVYNNIPQLKAYHKRINTIRQTSNLTFSYHELKSNFTEEEITDIKNIINANNISSEILATSRVPLHKSRLKDYLFCADPNARSILNERFDEIFHLQLQDEYNMNKRILLNQLEFFSMYFSTGLARADTVYQSLHQSFIATITILYFDITIINTDPKDQYYTHITELFNDWNNKYNSKLKKEKSKNAMLIEDLIEKPVKYNKK